MRAMRGDVRHTLRTLDVNVRNVCVSLDTHIAHIIPHRF